MFILGDESRSHGRIPWVTFSLIGINVLVFAAQLMLGPNFTYGFSLVPKEIAEARDLVKPEVIKVKIPVRVYYVQGKKQTQFREAAVTVPQAPGPFPIFLTLITSMFLHGGWLHLIGNMWFLAVFGRNVECALDHGRFLVFYLACGLIGGIVFTISDAHSVVPCLGASGAISGVMGAYVAIHPLNLISVWLGWFIGVIKLPAIVVLGVWFLFQYLSAFAALEAEGTKLGGVAYWDHLGGFLAGLGIVWGMIYYLRYQQSQQPPEEEQLPPTGPETKHQAAADPFGSFLPNSTSQARKIEDLVKQWR